MSSETDPAHLALVPTSQNMRNTFDFNLPEEFINHILLMLSARPRHVYPMCFVEPRDVLAAMGLSKQVRNVALKKFNSVLVSAWIDKSFELDKEDPGLCVKDPSVFAALLDALGGKLRKLSEERNLDNQWTDVLVREARPITELALYSLGEGFPLAAVLGVCSALKRLRLGFTDIYFNAQHLLECIAEHASQVIELEILHVAPSRQLGHIWPRLELLEVLKISNSDPILSEWTSDMYDGIAHDKSRVRSLNLGWIIDKRHFSAILELCRSFGCRPLDLDVCLLELKRKNLGILVELSQLKRVCPQVAVSLGCSSSQMLSAMPVLRDSLVKIYHSTDILYETTSLAHRTRHCSKLRGLELTVLESNAEQVLEQLLSNVGPALRELDLKFFSQGRPTALSERARYLASLALHTGNLVRLKLTLAFDTPLRSIAIANPLLRGVQICFRDYGHKPQHEDVERWITTTVDDFCQNCTQIKDIVIDDKNNVLHGIPIDALDMLRLSSLARRKIGVCVGSLERTSCSTISKMFFDFLRLRVTSSMILKCSLSSWVFLKCKRTQATTNETV